MEYNGGSVIAMAGKDCVAVASDLRLGNQALTIGCNFEKVRVQFDLMRVGCNADEVTYEHATGWIR